MRVVTYVSLPLWGWVLAGLLSGAGMAADAVQQKATVARRSPVTGLATFVRPSGGRHIPVTVGPGGGRVRARDFLQQYGNLFGITDADRQLVVDAARTFHDELGFEHTTYQQVHRGVPVFSGVLKVHQDAAGGVRSANGDFYPVPDKLVITPTISSERAILLAREALELAHASAEQCELVIVDPAWYGDAPKGVRLAYHVVMSEATSMVREAFFLDAHSGTVLDRWDLMHTARNRQVFNANLGTMLPGALQRSEGQAPVASSAVNAAYDYSGDFYGYFSRGFQRDSLDNGGLSLISSVNYNAPTFCPNAQWNGAQSIYCPGAATDDIVAHEFAHGLTQYTANLIYQNQSGMLNESFSDVFGELVDLFNGNAAFAGTPGAAGWPIPAGYVGPGLDTPNHARNQMGACNDGTRWLIAEDSTGGFFGAFRDMWNPPCFNDPSTNNSSLMFCPASDNGGVHSGSGVGNHAFAMLVDGKSFNGQTVTGIGPIKAGAVWYRALTSYLTPASDYAEAYEAFNQAASDLIGLTPLDPRTGFAAGTAFSGADAQEVNKALLAVEMNTDGRCGASVNVLDSSPAPHCVPRFPIAFFDFESGAAGWTVSHSGPLGPPTPYDWVRRGNLPFQRSGQAFFCDDPSIGDCEFVDESSVHHLESPVIQLPAEVEFPFLTFTHFMASEPGYDGGNVRLSVNGAAFVLVTADRFLFNSYNATLVSAGGGNTNPLAGQPAWTGAGGGWGTTLIDLGGLVRGGDSVRVRFDFGKDGCTGVTGWFVDDVEIYDCMCTSSAQCDDGLFCTGVESCVNSLCESTGDPCGSGFCNDADDNCVEADFADSFENGNEKNWNLQGADTTALAGHWVIGDPVGTLVGGQPAQPEDAYQGTGCAFTGQNSSADVDDVDGGVVSLISPAIDLSRRNHAVFSYARWFYVRDLAPGSGDFFAVDISDNNGASWFTLEQLNQNQPAPAWTAMSWTLEDFILLTDQVRVRFRVGDGVAAVNIVEGAVDNVLVVGSGECNDPGDCDDGDGCTLDICQVDGTCVHQALSCLAIASSDPPSGAVDARQPHDLGAILPAMGIDQIDLVFSGGAVNGLTDADFVLDKQGGVLPPPVIIDVTPLGGAAIRITLSEPLEPASWLKVTHAGSLTDVCVGALPGDVNADDLVAVDDVAALAGALAGLPGSAVSRLSADLDRSGLVDAADITRLMDLLNGSGAFDPWLGAGSPPNPCP